MRVRVLSVPLSLSFSNLKFTAKQVTNLSKKCEKEEGAEKTKIKKAMEKGNMEGARIHAQNAIRNKTQALNYLRLSARLDSVSSKLESAIKMQQVTKTMGSVVKGMDKALASMNIEQISKVMEKFEQQFEDMDVKSEYIEGAMNGATSAIMPEEQVDTLMQQVADEHGLKMADEFKTAVPGAAAAGASSTAPQAAAAAGGGGSPEADLEERLRKLRS